MKAESRHTLFKEARGLLSDLSYFWFLKAQIE